MAGVKDLFYLTHLNNTNNNTQTDNGPYVNENIE